ncbi:MAG: DUF465 domain-containing protein [Proteobacteria bacterium]|nr:DUF465 domain-containing protein [Pseudomonadota bacterium]
MGDDKLTRERIEELRDRHRELDEELTCLTETPVHDQLKAQRLKKQKLALKDQISYLEDASFPDIIA